MSSRHIVVISLPLLIGSLAAICIACAFVQLYINTHALLECRQRIALSSDATEEDMLKLSSLEQSLWARLPKWAFVVIATVAFIVTYAGFYAFTVASYFSIVRRLSGSRNKDKKPKDEQKQ